MPKKDQMNEQINQFTRAVANRRLQCAGETVNIFWDTDDGNLVTDIYTSLQSLDTCCEIIPGTTTFTDANACLYQQGFRIVASIQNEDGAGAVYTYVRC
ncbi:hypothetical protein [Fredinandcohnia quinoae]|uniref:Uncharacterized protein n=1 Tax=Fredinandcohnia quinoae TaxID=2918902 RepID=A0AAW5EA13_9BACI|nr:hypothetical protein [Fredinandcohnia sp. SECRCQ15]MCH1626246.1 hypothetical protein [Fredinandcohnia sp. SECRCQ15]